METTHSHVGVALVGRGAVTALGTGLKLLETALQTNGSGLAVCSRLIGRGYESAVVGSIPQQVMDSLRTAYPEYADGRAFVLAREALSQAEEELPGRLQAVPGSRRGLVLSTTKADIEILERVVGHESVTSLTRRHLHPALLAVDLALAQGVQGPIRCVSAACISGLSAIQQGAALLRRQEADLVFVVGVDLLSHFVLAGFSSLKSLDPDGCRPFDRSRVGLSLGEGAGAVILARTEDMSAPGMELLGCGLSNDANHLTGPSRDGSGLALAILRALGDAGVFPEQVDFAHMHGTGTPYNDAMESHALRAVFGEKVPPFCSSKGMLGHTLGAAGILETILCDLALRARILPGTPRLTETDPVVPGSVVMTPRPASGLRYILKVNCGFGGTNAAMVFGRR